MSLNKIKVQLLFVFFVFMSLIYLKNQVFCYDFFGNCVQEPFGGDLKRYVDNHYNNSINSIHGLALFLTFSLTHSWLEFKNFLILFQLVFYAVLFFSGLRLFEKISFLKFNLFLFLIIFFPIYDGYSSIGLKQGLGIIFMLSSIFLVKKMFSFKSWCLIIPSIMSHYGFILFYFVFYISKFFSIKSLTILFLFSVIGYIFQLNGFLFYLVVEIFETMQKSLYVETWLRFNNEVNYFNVFFSFLPLLFFKNRQFRNFINKEIFFRKIYKFHLLFSSIIFLFFSEFYYINRFLSLTWVFYPFYLLIFIDISKLNYKFLNIKKQNT